MRTVVRSVTFSTDRFKDSEENEADISSLVNSGMLAIYMGVKRLGRIIIRVQQYTDIGYPIAIVFQASCFDEFVVKGRLSNIISRLQHYSIEAKPGICIIGGVVDYTENTPKSYGPMKQFHVASGSRHDTFMFCEHLYDESCSCLLNPNDTSNGTYHSLQYDYYDAFIKQQGNVTYTSTDRTDANTVLYH